MADENGRWGQFENGLTQGESIGDEFWKNNRKVYGDFREKYCDIGVKFPFILVCFSTSKRKRKGKGEKSDPEQSADPIKTRMLNSIMSSSYQKGVPVVAVIKCGEGEDCDVVYRQAYEGKVIKLKKITRADEIRNNVDKGYRVVFGNQGRFTLRSIIPNISKILIAIYHLVDDLSIVEKIKRFFGFAILSFFAVQIERVKNFLPGIVIWAVYAFFILFIVLGIKGIIEKIKVSNEVKCLGEIGYPAIFFNASDKNVGWIKSFIEKVDEHSSRRPSFCISVDELNIPNVKEFVIPKEYPNWGWLCLCKLVRDMADSPWNDRTLKKDMDALANNSQKIKAYCYDVQYVKNVWKLQQKGCITGSEQIKKRIDERIGRYWSFCIIDEIRGEQDVFPIGNSVYVSYQQRSEEDLLSWVEEHFKNFSNRNRPEKIQIWSIQVIATREEAFVSFAKKIIESSLEKLAAFIKKLWHGVLRFVERAGRSIYFIMSKLNGLHKMMQTTEARDQGDINEQKDKNTESAVYDLYGEDQAILAANVYEKIKGEKQEDALTRERRRKR